MTEEELRQARQQIAFLSRELELNLKKNRELTAALTRQTLDAAKSFRELREQFDALAQEIYDVIVFWVKKLQRPITYDEIIRYYKTKNPKIEYTSETITRQVRELKEHGWLHSPLPGSFVPIKRGANPLGG